MELHKNENEPKKNKLLNTKEKNQMKKAHTNNNKDVRFIQTNYYLNDFNYYKKNILKMNKLREEKIKEHKKDVNNDKKIYKMPKILYFNKFIHNKEPKRLNKNNLKTISNAHIISNTYDFSQFQIKTENEVYKKIEQAILSKSIEENSKTHIKKTIKAFDELLQSVDNFKFKNKKVKPQLVLKENDNSEMQLDENSDNDEDLKIEEYNFDKYKQKYQNEKKKKGNISNNDIEIQLNNNNFFGKNDTNENIYITAQGAKFDENKKDNNKIEISQKDNKKINLSKNKNNKKINLTINNMISISDESLASQIKNIRRNFKKELYFNRNNFGKFKITELGLNYPQSLDKYKKYPDYKGNDLEEKRMFNYKTKVSNPRYNYSNIGSFNEKFNKDLSQISNFYGKEQAKGRFIRNPLISMFSKYITKYEQYKDLKFIENRYTDRNKYSFRLKPLINKGKNNFDRLANNIYNKEHKTGF